MQVENYDGSVERKIVTAMIVNDKVLGQIAHLWNDGGRFAGEEMNLLAGRCVRYYERHRKAPGRGMEALFIGWAAKHPSDPRVPLTERLLANMDAEYRLNGSLDVAATVELAEQRINEVRLNRISDGIAACMRAKEFDKASELLQRHRPITLDQDADEFPFDEDVDWASHVTKEKQEPLLRYDGALGQFFKNLLRRQKFIMFHGPEKVGKSWWLLDIAWRALRAQLKVAFFSVGDMMADALYERLISRAANAPLVSHDDRWPFRVGIPRAIKSPVKDEDGNWQCAEVVREDKVFEGPPTPVQIAQAKARFVRDCLRSKQRHYYQTCRSAGSISAEGVKATLERLDLRYGFVPDVVVVDYADILAPPKQYKELRDQYKASWEKQLSIAQDRNCLYVSASQTSAKSYNRRILDKTDFSEDKRKHATPNAVIGINVFGEEKREQVTRLNIIVAREIKYTSSACVNVAGCLEVGNPAVVSTW